MKTFKTIIVEDDPLHREHLIDLLSTGFPQIKLIKVCKTAKEALEFIPLMAPDVVFMDINLGEHNAFDVLSTLQTSHIHVVFTTAYSDWAIKAFEINAIHYLLKPIDPDDLRIAIERIENTAHNTDLSAMAEAIHKRNNRMLVIREKTVMQYLPIDQIVYLHADESYTKVFWFEKNVNDLKTTLSSHNLSYYEAELQSYGFIRIHKSFLINSAHLRRFDRAEQEVILSGNVLIPVSRQKRHLLG